MPVMQQLGMADGWDQLMVTRILAISELWPEETLCVPVTIDSLLQRSFLRWLRDRLLQCNKALRKRILFELTEADVCQHINRLQPVFRILYGFGCRRGSKSGGFNVCKQRLHTTVPC